jgi:hypothetical protein
MPKPITDLIQPTPSGVKIELKSLYVYADGHANLVFGDNTNWPLADEYEAVELISGKLLRPMQKAARKVAKKTPPA